MKFLRSLINNKTFIAIILVCLLSLFLNFYKKDAGALSCLNADEAAYGYNAYSLLKTGSDEYGAKLPLRFKSFGDFKLPLYGYLSIPIIASFGLNNSIRYLNTIVALLFPVIMYFLTKEFFSDKRVALFSSFLIATSLGLHLIGRQAHEGYLSVALISTALLFFMRYLKKSSSANLIYLLIFSTFALFSYQFGRIFIFFLLLTSLILTFKKKVRKILPISLVFIFMLFSITDFIYKPERVKRLLFFTTAGFSQKIQEMRMEGGNRIPYNKLTIGIKTVLNEHIKYFSPDYLSINGDTNYRFGYPEMSYMTLLQYLFVLIGFYYLFKNKERWRYLLLLIFLVAPLPASLAWQSLTLPRALFIFVPSTIIAGYGAVQLLKSINKKYYKVAFVSLIVLQLIFLFYSWDFYLNHYSSRAVTTYSRQCGYKELVDYVHKNYNKFDKFYITRKHGQPYIFLLYYLKYAPQKYQPQALLTKPDDYGFGQIDKFDKFIFDWPNTYSEEGVVYIGFPDDFKNISRKDIKKIELGTEEIFSIYERAK